MPSVSLEKTQNRIGSMFDRIAATYDFLNHTLSLGLDIQWRNRAVRSLPARKNDLVLDVATGTGDLAFALLRARPKARIVGVDLARNMLRIAREKRRRQGIAERCYSVLAGDALQLPFSDNRFDALMIAYGIRNVPDMGRALKEFHRVLKPGGHLLVLEFSLPRLPLLRNAYIFYFEKILPRLGGFVSGDSEAYAYLPASVGAFVTPEELQALTETHGFHHVLTRLLTGGVTYFLLARKTELSKGPNDHQRGTLS